MTLVLRTVKGSPLTHAEEDGNFQHCNPQGKHTEWVSAAGRLYGAVTNGAASNTTETTTHKLVRRTLDFDATTVEYGQFSFRPPKSWDKGTLTAVFVWSHASASSYGVRWGIQGVAVADDDAFDIAFGSPVYTSDTGGTADNIYITDETDEIPFNGVPLEESFITFRILRDPTHADDTLDTDARLHGVTLYYFKNSPTDD
jgi:hypothetical protein